ncbi:HPP family protein [Alteromonas sp. a30]|uniref:HPP family protein n=1 Tax=Alteromonas sp. a30 TaxID=2730917 RepID=UPI0022812705|nr:HPP family protein [Alteromonas sp. a30]MCY7295417.1 HPP family protein [Alteromonas sp. a30]
MGKLSGGGALPPKPTSTDLIRGFVGGFIGILGLSLLTKLVDQPLLMAPFGATCVILFAASASPLAQPRNVIGGHFVSTLIGLVALYTLGNDMVVVAASVGLSVAAMQFFRVVHPPAGANPIVVLIAGAGADGYGFDFLVFPVLLGAIFLVGVASLINNVGSPNKWPLYWYGLSSK